MHRILKKRIEIPEVSKLCSKMPWVSARSVRVPPAVTWPGSILPCRLRRVHACCWLDWAFYERSSTQQFAAHKPPPLLSCREGFRLFRALGSLPAPVPG
jgi:hypothetical protein